MTIVKTYKGHDVPEGATHYGDESLGKQEGFYLFFHEWWYGYSPNWNGAQKNTCITSNDLIELPQEPETFVPVAGEEWKPVAGEWCVHLYEGRHEPAFIIGKNRLGDIVFQGKASHCFYSDPDSCFLPEDPQRQKIKEWVESNIDCVEAFEMDQAILITQLLDLGALVMPESSK